MPEFRFAEFKPNPAFRARLVREYGREEADRYDALFEALEHVPVRKQRFLGGVDFKPEHAARLEGLTMAQILDRPNLDLPLLKALKDHAHSLSSSLERHLYRLALAKAVLEHGAEKTFGKQPGLIARVFGRKGRPPAVRISSQPKGKAVERLTRYANAPHVPTPVAAYVRAAAELLRSH